MRRVRVMIVTVEEKQTVSFKRDCASVFLSQLRIWHAVASFLRRIILSFVVCLSLYSHYLMNGTIFGEKLLT
jgi:hypothetical protein